MNCVDCDHPLRPRGVTIADAPGTRKTQPGGRCPKCYEDAPREGKQKAHECATCERKLRPSGTTLLEHPNTVVHKGRGFCATCWREDKGLTKYRRGTRPTECRDCEHPLRPQRTTAEQYPGTALYGADGKCSSCYKRGLRDAARKPKPAYEKSCEGCDHPLRPKDRPEADFPGTVVHAGKGLCNSCYAHDRRNTPRGRTAPVAPSEPTDPALLRLMAQRQERIRRQEHVQRVRVAQEAARRRFIAERRVAA